MREIDREAGSADQRNSEEGGNQAEIARSIRQEAIKHTHWKYPETGKVMAEKAGASCSAV
jgi:hypothetical protein